MSAILEDPASFPPGVRELVGSSEAWERLEAFAALLHEQGELRGLIGPREIPRLWSRHLVNSLAISSFIPEVIDVCDVGSGAGFPGLVLAITRPTLDLVLVETMERRCDWLRDASEALSLRNVEIVRARAEDLAGEREFSIVTARAVAALDKLLRWTWPLVGSGGAVLAMKGSRASDEVDAAWKVLKKYKVAAKVHPVRSPLDDSVTNVVEVRRFT